MVRSFFLSASFAAALYFVVSRWDRIANLHAILPPLHRDPVVLLLLFVAAFVAGYNLLLRR